MILSHDRPTLDLEVRVAHLLLSFLSYKDVKRRDIGRYSHGEELRWSPNEILTIEPYGHSRCVTRAEISLPNADICRSKIFAYLL